MATTCSKDDHKIKAGYGIWTFTFSLRLPGGRRWPDWTICDAGGCTDNGNVVSPKQDSNRLRNAEQYLRMAALGGKRAKGQEEEFIFWGLNERGNVEPHMSGWPRTPPQQPMWSCELRSTHALYPPPGRNISFPIRRPRLDKEEYFANEFLVTETGVWPSECPKGSPDETTCKNPAWRSAYKAQFNLAAILAYRRSQLLARTMAQRVYHVFLPWGWLFDVTDKQDNAAANATLGYLVFPSLTLTRRPDTAHFRRTFSLTLTLAPVTVTCPAHNDKRIDDKEKAQEVNYVEPRGLPGPDGQGRNVPEAHRLLRSLHSPEIFLHRDGQPGEYRLEGPLEKYVEDLGKRLGEKMKDFDKNRLRTFWLRGLARILLSGVALNCDEYSELDADQLHELTGIVHQAVSVSAFAGHVRALNVSSKEVRDWVRTPDRHSRAYTAICNFLENDLKSWIRNRRLDVHEDPSTFRLSYKMGLDEPTPLLYIPWEKLVLEVFGNDVRPDESSHLWVAGWQHMLTTGVSALSETVGSFHREIDRQRDVASSWDLAREYVVDCEEYLDLDLHPYFKPKFRELKEMVGLQKEYERLRDKVKLLTEATRTQEQSRLSSTVVWLTMVAVFLGVATLVGPFKSPIARMSIGAVAAVLMTLMVREVLPLTPAHERRVLWLMLAALVGGVVILGSQILRPWRATMEAVFKSPGMIVFYLLLTAALPFMFMVRKVLSQKRIFGWLRMVVWAIVFVVAVVLVAEVIVHWKLLLHVLYSTALVRVDAYSVLVLFVVAYVVVWLALTFQRGFFGWGKTGPERSLESSARHKWQWIYQRGLERLHLKGIAGD